MMSVTHGIYGIVSSQEQNMTKDEGDALIDLCLFETFCLKYTSPNNRLYWLMDNEEKFKWIGNPKKT